MKNSLGNRKRKAIASLSITSLMDVLTIILLFLLVNYSEQQQQSDISKDIKLPQVASTASDKIDGHIRVTVGTHKLSIGNKEVRYRSIAQDRERVMNDVAVVFNTFKIQTDQKKDEPIRVSILADKDTSYEIVDAVIAAAATQNITQIELVALGTKK